MAARFASSPAITDRRASTRTAGSAPSRSRSSSWHRSASSSADRLRPCRTPSPRVPSDDDGFERDPYQVLGLPRGASLEDVKRAYRRSGEGQPPRCGRRGSATPIPRDPGGVRADRGFRTGQAGASAAASRPPRPTPTERERRIGRMGLVVAGLGPALHPVAFPEWMGGRNEWVGRDEECGCRDRGPRAPPGPSASARGRSRWTAIGWTRAAREQHGGAISVGRRRVEQCKSWFAARAEPARPARQAAARTRAARRLTPTRTARSVSRRRSLGPWRLGTSLDGRRWNVRRIRRLGGPQGTRRGRNKATFGSTSYDGVDATPFEPDWRGASWYGTTSGTYWTLNPKEYADPRKHGPEYQARARRTGRGRPAADPTAVAVVGRGCAMGSRGYRSAGVVASRRW